MAIEPGRGTAGAGPREVSTGEGPAREGQAAVGREVQQLRARGQALARETVYEGGVPVGVALVVTDAVRAPESGVRGVAGVREADRTAPDPVYAPQRLSEAAMVALIGADGVARARAAEGLGAAVEITAPVPGPTDDVAGFSAAAPGTGRVDGGRRAVRVRRGAGVPRAITGVDEVTGYAVTGTVDAAGSVTVVAETPASAVPASEPGVYVEPVAGATHGTIDPSPEAMVTSVPMFDVEPGAMPLGSDGQITITEALPPPRADQKAASDTDTPSRGLPTVGADGAPKTSSGLPILGGFAEEGTIVGEASYFPFDGWELGQTVVRALTERLLTRVADDLRFSRAIVYPRVSVRLELVVEAFGQDAAMTVPVVWAPAAGQPGSTPVAVAAAHADDLVFVLRETLQEFDAAGNPETPPNAVREELGLDVPMKRRVKTGRGFQIVDRVR